MQVKSRSWKKSFTSLYSWLLDISVLLFFISRRVVEKLFLIFKRFSPKDFNFTWSSIHFESSMSLLNLLTPLNSISFFTAIKCFINNSLDSDSGDLFLSFWVLLVIFNFLIFTISHWSNVRSGFFWELFNSSLRRYVWKRVSTSLDLGYFFISFIISKNFLSNLK